MQVQRAALEERQRNGTISGTRRSKKESMHPDIEATLTRLVLTEQREVRPLSSTLKCYSVC
jgi:hypothetical protein